MKKFLAANRRAVANSYKTLVRKIAREFADLEAFVKNRVAKSHWNVGQYIDEHLLEHKDRADYAMGFYDKLAEDVDREKTTLMRAVQFYRAYPILAFPRELTWEHYKGLITVKDATERKKPEEEIVRQNGDARKLRKFKCQAQPGGRV